MPKQHAYQGYEISIRVEFNDQDIEDYFASVDNISARLDYPKILVFTTSDCNISLNDDTGYFSPQNENNFFVSQGLDQDGYECPVSIYGGFIVNGNRQEELIFSGIIVDVFYDGKIGETKIECTSNDQDLRQEKITDFGLEKTFLLEQGSSTRSRGSYPIPMAIRPFSDESTSGISTQGSMTEVENVDTEGDLSPLNYEVSDREIATEGGPLDNNPTITAKVPYRHKTVDFIIRQILSKYNISNSRIELLEVQVSRHFSSLGRPGYDIENSVSTTNETFSFKGSVTDVVYQSSENKLFMLYSSPNNNPKLISLDLDTDTWETVYTHSSNAEFWGLATTNFTTFYIMGTSGTRGEIGTYDPGETGASNTRIWSLTSGTLTPLSLTYSPQIAKWYVLGFSDLNSDTLRQGTLPETISSIRIHNNNLYYRYATNTTFGIVRYNLSTRAQTRLAVLQKDNRRNQTSLSFTIRGTTLYYGVTATNASNSSFEVRSRPA